jgi:hypothetical protein
MLGADILARKDALASRRVNFEAQWREIIQYMRPDAPDPYNNPRAGQGEKTRREILDSTGEMALELLAAALHGSLTNPATDWFMLRAEDDALMERDDVAIALEAATQEMLTGFRSPSAHFTSAIHETYLDLVGFGIGHLFIADRKRNSDFPVLYQPRPVAELLIDENAEGVVDTWIRSFEMSARQAAQEPGWQLPEAIAKAAREPKQQDEAFEFVQMIAPNEGPRRRDTGPRGRQNMPYANTIVAAKTGEIVYQGGFEEAPLVSPRWSKRAGEVYGRGPGMKALPDVKMLQRMARATIRGAEKTIDPPLMVPDDGVMSPVRLTSGGLTTVRAEMLNGAGSPIRPIVTDANVSLGVELMKQVQGRVEMAFYSHLIQINQDYRMTATQVLEISERTMQALSPMLGRVQSELLGPLVERDFAIRLRAGRFRFPPVLDRRPLKIEYVSPIVRAQKLSEAQGMLRAIAAGQQIAAGGMPEVMDNFDLDAQARRLAGYYGTPKSDMRAPEVVAEMRRARAEVAQQQAQRQGLKEVAETAAMAGGAVKDFAGLQPQGTA